MFINGRAVTGQQTRKQPLVPALHSTYPELQRKMSYRPRARSNTLPNLTIIPEIEVRLVDTRKSLFAYYFWLSAHVALNTLPS